MWQNTAMFKIFCKRANCDAQMISGAGGRRLWTPAKAATGSAARPWQVAGEMLKWMADGRRMKLLIPIAVGEKSIAFPRRSAY